MRRWCNPLWLILGFYQLVFVVLAEYESVPALLQWEVLILSWVIVCHIAIQLEKNRRSDERSVK